MGVLEELEQAIAQVTERVGPAVVGIGGGWALGSGVVVADGLVLTNAHNVHGDEVTATFAEGRSTTGTVAGLDVDGDLAVVALDTAGATAIEWGPDQAAGLGSAVFALANPGGRGLRVTFGTVSATQRAFRG
ncbi:MAG: serine protease, partial [Actinomycetota bacterium]|nr:serine protease [Actinomycetota bacterium]